MNRQLRALFLIVAGAGWIGCGSSDGQKPTSMGDVGAALDQQAQASPAPGATPNSATPGTGAPAELSASSAPAATSSPPETAADPAIASKRGFGLEDWSNEAAYVLVKTDAAKMADLLAKVLTSTVVPNVLGKPADENAAQALVFQLSGHSWSIVAIPGDFWEKFVPALSTNADVIVFSHSDFNAWASVKLFRGGEEVEAVHWGPAGDGLGEDADASKWHTTGTVTTEYEGITSDDTYLFRSKLRKLTPADLQKGEVFIDEFFKQQDAYLPDAEQMPWYDYDTKTITSPLGAAGFTGVHAVDVAMPGLE
jgi:hypothetical protein